MTTNLTNKVKRILFIPTRKAGRGGGHLSRCTALVDAINEAGGEAVLYSPSIANSVFKKNWDFIVMDYFCAPQKDLEQLMALAPVLCIDEGASRKNADFLFDLLPNLSKHKPNICAPRLLPLPQKRRVDFYFNNGMIVLPGGLKILISFGAEDSADLTLKTVSALLVNEKQKQFSLTVVLGNMRKNNNKDKEFLEQYGVTVIDACKTPINLKEVLAEYDLLVTHFGICAFEALYARLPVLLINPSNYHQKLSRFAGLAKQSIHYKTSFADFYKGCVDQSIKAAQKWGLEETAEESLANVLLNASPGVYRKCPLCRAAAGKVIGRFPGRTYRLCSCGTITMSSLNSNPVEYNREYFFAEYQKQYGVTYLQDFPQLIKAAERRLSNILPLMNTEKTKLNDNANASEKKQLLDIGCAYGPFLKAAHNAGFEATGIDPIPEAVAYVGKELGLNALLGTFDDVKSELHNITMTKGKFDLVSLWYVIEHFQKPGQVLSEINSLLNMGGVLAFSTPSAKGISRKKNMIAFLEHSPVDHWTIWNPSSCKKILKRYGFTLKKKVITGHHPERFCALSKNKGFFWSFAMRLSKVFGLGDTFECYAIKTAEAKRFE